MDLTLSHCFIQVLDQDEALAFYRDILDLELRAFPRPLRNMVRFSGRPKS